MNQVAVIGIQGRGELPIFAAEVNHQSALNARGGKNVLCRGAGKRTQREGRNQEKQ